MRDFCGAVGRFPIREGYYYDFKDKKAAVRSYVDYMLSRTQRIFKYNGLPETIPHLYLERYLQRNGQCCITKVNGELYALVGGLGEVPNPYYFPTHYIVANPYLNFTASLEIGKDCVFIRNDSEIQGLIPMHSKYASLLVENDITMRMANINTRIPVIAAVHGDQEYQGLQTFYKHIEEGEQGIGVKDDFHGTLKTMPYASNSNGVDVTDLIEFHQYCKGAWFNELGIKASFNMKREAISASESAQNDDTLIPLIDDMLYCRQNALEEVNKLYGTNITVELDSVWAITNELNELSLDAAEAEVEAMNSEEESNRLDENKDGDEDVSEEPTEEN